MRTSPTKLLIIVTASLGLSLAGSAPVAQATAPPPPLDPCLAKGSFNIADPECQLRHAPTFGDQFGPIGSVVTHVATRGDTIALGFNPGDDVFYDRPISCGDVACIYHGIFWRPQDDIIRANWMQILSGCGGRDETCRFRVWPDNDTGDDAEKWLVVYAQHYRGIFPQKGVAHAVYVAPRFYPVALDTLDASGATAAPEPGSVAYAVRAGRSVSEAACAPEDWWVRLASEVAFTTPDCIALPGWGGGYQGVLPVDSGDWTIVAAPAGVATAPLLTRPTPYRALSVRPVGDDIRASLVEAPRPRPVVTIEPETATMAPGSTQDVRVTVAAVGGETGDLSLAFDDPAVLAVEPIDPPMLLTAAPEDSAGADFTLAPGTERTFLVRVNAVAVGEALVDAIASGTDDLGHPVTGSASSTIAVVEETGEGGTRTEAIQPPTVDRAAAAAPGTSGPGQLEGTATGTPGGTMTVTIWTSAAASGAICAPRVSGPGVQLVGSTDVPVGEDGTGPFAFNAPLTAGWYAYGVASVGSQVSKVGECTLVAADMPTIFIADAITMEGTAGSGTTDLEVTISLSQPDDLPVSVRLSTMDGSATSPADYAALDDVEVVFAPGDTVARVVIGVIPDADLEDDETVLVRLTSPVNGRLASPGAPMVDEATAMIADDDGDAVDVAQGPDLRGVWKATYRVKYDGKMLVTRYIITILTQDPVTGAVTGRFVMDPWLDEPTLRGKLTGTITGDQVRLSVTGDKKIAGLIVDGPLKAQDGKLVLRSRSGLLKYVLTDPGSQ